MSNLPPARHTAGNTVVAVDEIQKAPGAGLPIAQSFKWATMILAGFQLLMILLLGTCGRDSYHKNGAAFTGYYNAFTGVEIMMFIGFGYLMTFLKRYGMGSIGLTMLMTVVCLQWGIWIDWFFSMWFETDWTFIDMNIKTLDTGLTLVATILISFGAVIGKVNPLQLVIMALMETLFYAFNKNIFLEGSLALMDPGGTIQIHMFGAYFGLAVSMMLGKPSQGTENEVNHVSDIFSFIGTLFLFIYWPSFNGGELEPNSAPQQRAIVHTVLSLCAATVGTFIMSSYLNTTSKFRPVDIQNATLAGGVAVGSVCSLTMQPSDPLLIGLVAGLVSCYGFARIQPMLEARFGLHDTCGIHNLHAMPSVIGALTSIFLTAYKGPRGHDMPAVFDYTDQAGHQLAGVLLTLLVCIPTGIITGYVMKRFASLSTAEDFSDYPYWEVHPWTEGPHAEAALLGNNNGANTYDKIETGRASEEEEPVDEGEVELTHVTL